MGITLKHLIPLVGGEADDRVEIEVRYDVAYHYDPGGWTSYGGDPPSHELDVNDAQVEEWRMECGMESAVLASMTKKDVQALYDKWADEHSDEIEAELFDKIQDGYGEPDYD